VVPHGSLNGTSTTCGTTRELTCDPCYDMVGNGVAVCSDDGTWAFESRCTIKGIVAHFNTMNLTNNSHQYCTLLVNRI